MNRYFDFTSKQLRFLIVLVLLAVVLSILNYIATKSATQSNLPGFEIHLGQVEQNFTGTFILDPNLAPADSLELLPGIGKVLADRIVAYRINHRFEKEIDITEVKGIGPKLYEKIKPYLKVNRN